MTSFLIAHLSDAHIGPLPEPRARELIGKRLTGYLNWKRRDRIHDMDVLTRLVADMRAHKPDHIMMTGDVLNIGLPAGFLNIGVHISKEWNHNGFCADSCTKPGGPVDFHATPELEFVWLYSLSPVLDFKGFMNVVAPKGKDGFGGQTYTEVLAVPKLSLDLGKLAFNHPHKPDVYLAVELWEHKFGASSRTAGSEQVAPTIGMEFHF